MPATSDDLILDQDVDDMGFGVGFTQLMTIRRPASDQWPEITNVKGWVGAYLREWDERLQGGIRGFAEERLYPAVKPLFAEYLRR